MRPVRLIFPPLRDGDMWRVRDVRTAAARGPSQILLAPGALVMAHDVEAIGRTGAQARAASLSALAPEMATPGGDCVCALGATQDGRRMANVMTRRALDELIRGAKAQGHAPDAVIADFSVLPQPETGSAIVAQHGDCLVRTDTSSFACQPDVLPLLLGDRTVQEVDFESAAIACIREGRHLVLPDLVIANGGGNISSARRAPVAAGIAATAALSLFAALPWIEASQLNGATSRLRAETEAIAHEALPDAQRIVNPLAQLREASLPRALSTAGLGHAVTVVEGLARSPGVAIARLSFEGETVTAHVGVSSTSLLQPLRDHIAANGLQLVETPGLSEPNSIPVELTVVAAP